MPFDHQNTPLSPEQARVLATLMEKQRTVPDSYPLTLNAVVTAILAPIVLAWFL